MLRKSGLSSIVPRAIEERVNNKPVILADQGEANENSVDPNAIGYIIAINKAIRTTKGDQRVATGHSPPVDFLLDREFANDIRGTYDPIKMISTITTDADRLPAVSNAIQRATLTSTVAAATLINEGDAGFGIPLVFTAAEKSLKVEASLARKYDIYWIQLAINPSEELI